MLQKNEIDLKDLIFIFKKHIIFILAATVAISLAFFLFSSLFIEKQYQAQATLIVNASAETSESITYNDVTMSQMLVDTYAIILKSNTLLNNVISNLGLNMSTETLADKVSVSAVGTTDVISLTVNDTSPQQAVAIANKIIELAPAEIIRTVKAGSVEVISSAEAGTKPVSPNIFAYTAAGFFIGLAGSGVIAFLIEVLDDKIKSAEELQNKLGYTVIGVIPNIAGTRRKGGFRNV